MMKTKLIISGLALIAITTVAGAQQNNQKKCERNCVEYVDANKNGVCDNNEKSGSVSGSYKKAGCGKNCGMGKGNRGITQGQGKRLNFTDADKNGICDRYEAPAKK
jgi:hypothetical protein